MRLKGPKVVPRSCLVRSLKINFTHRIVFFEIRITYIIDGAESVIVSWKLSFHILSAFSASFLLLVRLGNVTWAQIMLSREASGKKMFVVMSWWVSGWVIWVKKVLFRKLQEFLCFSWIFCNISHLNKTFKHADCVNLTRCDVISVKSSSVKQIVGKAGSGVKRRRQEEGRGLG